MNDPSIVDAFHQLAGREDADRFAAIMKDHGVARTVLVQPAPSAAQTGAALELAASLDWVGGVSAWVDLTSPGVGTELDRLMSGSKLCAVCVPADQEKENRWLLRDDVMRGLRAVAERQLAVDLLVEPRNLPSVAEVAKAMPELRMVIDHLGSPFIAQGIREPWGVYMLNLAVYPNVWCKVSGLVTRDVQPGWNVAHFEGFVKSVVRMFGYDRMMFGSDWPRHEEAATYAQVLDAALTAAGPFTSAQRDRFLRGSACEFYRLS